MSKLVYTVQKTLTFIPFSYYLGASVLVFGLAYMSQFLHFSVCPPTIYDYLNQYIPLTNLCPLFLCVQHVTVALHLYITFQCRRDDRCTKNMISIFYVCIKVVALPDLYYVGLDAELTNLWAGELVISFAPF